jgi:hypothetical protein
MATPTLDISLLGYFSPVLSFLLIWVLVYATLQYTKMLGENKIIHGAIAFLIGSFFLFAPEASGIVTFIAPWFAVLFIMSIFMIMGFKVFGATDGQIKGVITNWGPAQWSIGILGILIIIGGFSSVYGQQFLGFTGDDQPMIPSNQNPTAGSTASGDFEQNVAGVFFHPKILGTVFILIVVAVAIKMLSGDMKPDWPVR